MSKLNIRYNEVVKEISSLVNQDTSEIALLIDKLRKMERVKYTLSYLLVEYEKLVLIEKTNALNDMISDDKYKKVLNSSTLTLIVLDSRNGGVVAQHRHLQELLRNIRGSIDTTRTILSTEKSLIQLGGYNA